MLETVSWFPKSMKTTIAIYNNGCLDLRSGGNTSVPRILHWWVKLLKTMATCLGMQISW